MNNKYFVFLKMKQFESRIFKNLSLDISDKTIPIFDIPKSPNETEHTAKKSIDSGIKNLEANWEKIKPFYIDCKDLPTLNIQNQHIYSYTLENLYNKGFKIIPMLSIGRDKSHNEVAISFINANNSSHVGVRLDEADISDYDGFERAIENILSKIDKNEEFEDISITFFMDHGLLQPETKLKKINESLDFLDDFSESEKYKNHEIVIVGSSISATIGDHLGTKSTAIIERIESEIFKTIKSDFDFIKYGDYGIISPEYSEITLEPQFIQSVAAPKLFYTGENLFYLFRGGVFSKHPRKRKQYYDLAKAITQSPEYRGHTYSDGEDIIYKHSIEAIKPTSPGNWYKFLNIAHITFIVRDFL